jgi:hypothetical protein
MARGRPLGARAPACGQPPNRQQSALIGSPAPKRPPAEDPPLDPTAIPRAFAQARARRRARLEHRRELKRARLRFFALLAVLAFVTIFLAFSIWEKIRAVFGL